MRYYLFVDESGAFNPHKKEPWIVSGVLVASRNDVDPEVRLNACMDKVFITAKDIIGLPQLLKEDIHMTELRKQVGGIADDFAAFMLCTAHQQLGESIRYIAVVNSARIGSNDPQNQVKRTYLMMLLDLITLAESTIREENDELHLRLKIATRTFNQDPHLNTRITDITDLLSQAGYSFEIDLASRGLVDLLDKHEPDMVRLNSARWHWGLILADIVANSIYHHQLGQRTKINTLIDGMQSKEWLQLFPAFRNHAMRRALVAERDHAIALAIFRWITMSSKQVKDEVRLQHLVRLCRHALDRTPQGREALVDSVVDMVIHDWVKGDPGRYAGLIKSLGFFEQALQVVTVHERVDHQSLLFRIRNLRLQYCNHRGDTTTAGLIIAEQEKVLPMLSQTATYFPLSLDYQVIKLERDINSLDFTSAHQQADTYSQLVDAFGACWGLLNKEGQQAFSTSRTVLRARMANIRTHIYITPIDDTVVLHGLIDELRALTPLCHDPYDESRRWNMEILALLKAGNVKEASARARAYLKEIGDELYDIHRFACIARVAVDQLLANPDAEDVLARRVLELVQKGALAKRIGHPYDIVYRDCAMLYALLGKTDQANKYFSFSEQAARYMAQEGKIVKWLRFLREVHKIAISEKPGSLRGYLQANAGAEAYAHMIPSAWGDADLKSVLLLLRRASPY